jgi:hypothetical protein
MLEYHPGGLGVVGSNPAAPTNSPQPYQSLAGFTPESGAKSFANQPDPVRFGAKEAN